MADNLHEELSDVYLTLFDRMGALICELYNFDGHRMPLEKVSTIKELNKVALAFEKISQASEIMRNTNKPNKAAMPESEE
jgi:hypothetical protein